MNETAEVLELLFNSVVLGEAQRARELAKKAVADGVPADVALDKMMAAMRVVDDKYEQKEYFIVDVASSAAAMREAFWVLKPHLAVEPVDIGGKVVMGSLKGNIQGLGKDIVVATLRAAGFQVLDLGVDVAPDEFVDEAVQEEAQIIAISVSVDETVPFLRELIDTLRERQLLGTVRTVIGGPAVSEKTCRKFGIDAYARDAWDCVKQVRKLLAR